MRELKKVPQPSSTTYLHECFHRDFEFVCVVAVVQQTGLEALLSDAFASHAVSVIRAGQGAISHAQTKRVSSVIGTFNAEKPLAVVKLLISVLVNARKFDNLVEARQNWIA